jgi:hypothetical protein
VNGAALGSRGLMTMHVSAWFEWGEGPPASGVSPIRGLPNRTYGRGWRFPIRTDDLTTVVTPLTLVSCAQGKAILPRLKFHANHDRTTGTVLLSACGPHDETRGND